MSIDLSPNIVGAERLVEAVRDLASARSVDDVVEIVRTAARELTGADGATFVLRDGDRCFYVDEDAITPLWAGKRFPMETCISGWSMQHHETVAIEDIYVDDRIPHDAYRPTFVKSLVMVPIRTADPIGAIGNYWATHHQATDGEIRLLQALADSTAVALENARVLSELERRVDERTAELNAAYADLRQFSSSVAHDLREPIALITGFAELLQERVKGDLDSGGHLDRILDACHEMDGRISMLLTYARAGSAPLELETVELDEVVRETVDGLHAVVAERDAEVTVEGLPTVTGDRTLLGQLFQNLIANSLRYVPDERRPVVAIAASRREHGWEVTVADNGVGVGDDEREAIFEPFRRGSAAGDSTGTGLGLATCRRIAERHGGGISVLDGDGVGAVFAVSLPDAS